MKLATVTSLQDELGYSGDMTDFLAAADDALEAASVALAARLDTHFDQDVITDHFFVEGPTYVYGAATHTEFRLSRGLVQTLDAFHYAPLMAHFDTVDATDNLAGLLINKDKGVVKDLAYPYDRKYVRITYTAGFLPAGSYPDTYDPAVVPKWLQQAARAQAKLFLSDNPSVKGTDTNLDTKLIGSTLSGLIARYMRYAPTALLPL